MIGPEQSFCGLSITPGSRRNKFPKSSALLRILLPSFEKHMILIAFQLWILTKTRCHAFPLDLFPKLAIQTCYDFPLSVILYILPYTHNKYHLAVCVYLLVCNLPGQTLSKAQGCHRGNELAPEHSPCEVSLPITSNFLPSLLPQHHNNYHILHA